MTFEDAELAAFLHMHPGEVRTRAKRGLIPGAKIGRRWPNDQFLNLNANNRLSTYYEGILERHFIVSARESSAEGVRKQLAFQCINSPIVRIPGSKQSRSNVSRGMKTAFQSKLAAALADPQYPVKFSHAIGAFLSI